MGELPPTLRTMVDVLLASQHPMFLSWGSERAALYNDAYKRVLGSNTHPAWTEAWSGAALYVKDGLLVIDRRGFLEECYLDYSCTPIRDERGAVTAVFVTCSDTTRRVLGERRLKTLSELSARLAAARTPDEACALAAAVLDDARADIPFAKLYLLEGKNDKPRVVASSGDPLAPSDMLELPLTRGLGLPAGHLVIGVNPRLELDDAYRDFVNLVADHIGAALQNARAYADERARAEELGALDRVKTEFFSNISHELRTPLTLLLSPAEELLADRDHPLSDAQRTQVNLIHQNARRLLKLVSSVLDFSRIEAGRMRASFVPTDLPRLTAELTSVFGSAVQKAGLRYIIDCPPLANAAYVDREMWEKIVLNLVANAFKHTFEGCIVVTLREHADAFELTVEDTGIGIPPDELPRIFERFHRVRGAHERGARASGRGR